MYPCFRPHLKHRRTTRLLNFGVRSDRAITDFFAINKTAQKAFPYTSKLERWCQRFLSFIRNSLHVYGNRAQNEGFARGFQTSTSTNYYAFTSSFLKGNPKCVKNAFASLALPAVVTIVTANPNMSRISWSAVSGKIVFSLIPNV